MPDLHGRVTLMDKSNAHRRAPRRLEPPAGTYPLRSEPRDKFIPGQFICPHGACFDHDGNIFVVEWVEVGTGDEAAEGLDRLGSTTPPACGAAGALSAGEQQTHARGAARDRP